MKHFSSPARKYRISPSATMLPSLLSSTTPFVFESPKRDDIKGSRTRLKSAILQRRGRRRWGASTVSPDGSIHGSMILSAGFSLHPARDPPRRSAFPGVFEGVTGDFRSLFIVREKSLAQTAFSCPPRNAMSLLRHACRKRRARNKLKRLCPKQSALLMKIKAFRALLDQ